ncbi:15259_t:CDS:2, partial [Dentiscutata heterogama]
DEHQGQVLGLGQYLAEKFPIFNATEHSERIYKLCTVHFKRASEFDRFQWSSAHTYEKTNISDSYRDKSSLQRSVEATKKSQKRTNKNSNSQKSSKKTRLTKNSTGISRECSE